MFWRNLHHLAKNFTLPAARTVVTYLTFVLMANIWFLSVMMSIRTCFSVDEQAAVWWILSVMKKSRLVHSIKPSLDILVAVEGWLLVCFPFELVGFVFVKLVDLLSEETWEDSFPPR